MNGLTSEESLKRGAQPRHRKSSAKALRGTVDPALVDDCVMMVGNMRCNVAQATRLINAAGWDVANRRMQAAGRTSWNRGDYNAACAYTTKVFKQLGLAP